MRFLLVLTFWEAKKTILALRRLEQVQLFTQGSMVKQKSKIELVHSAHCTQRKSQSDGCKDFLLSFLSFSCSSEWTLDFSLDMLNKLRSYAEAILTIHPEKSILFALNVNAF